MHSSILSAPTAVQTTPTPSTSPSPPLPSRPFDPLSAFLDEQWPKFDLSPPSSPSAATSPTSLSTPAINPLPPQLHTLATQATSLTTALTLWQTDFAEAERQIRTAILDADAADASRHALHQELQLVLCQLETERHTVSHLRHELRGLHECIATLHEARTLEDRINRLVIEDQGEEIRQLRLRIDVLEREGGGVRRLFGKAAEGMRKGWDERQAHRWKERVELETSKERLFEGYRKRHSTTVESVVRKTSMLSLSREGEMESRSTLVSHCGEGGV